MRLSVGLGLYSRRARPTKLMSRRVMHLGIVPQGFPEMAGNVLRAPLRISPVRD
jgi:hypothetical protein